MTIKLYDRDAYLRVFSALVTGCEKAGKGYALTLDQTAFFPEGGGQSADTGTLGEAQVLDVQEKDGRILHYTDRPLLVGKRVEGAICWEQRFARMQNHSGEHVVSGLAHGLFGLNNVGFHMGESCMTIDFDGELSREQLGELEERANRAVWENHPIRCWYPEPETLSALNYRSKLELTENVRLVEIEGVDLCACCAPHVRCTGEIGLVKLLTAERHRGGVRVELICGRDAYEDYRRKQEAAAELSRLLSVPRDNLSPAVQRLLEQQESQKERIAALSMALVRSKAAACPETKGNLCLFDQVLDEVGQRELVNLLMERCGGVAAVFCSDGDGGFRYVMGSRTVNLRLAAREINRLLSGRGGGSETMIQGRAQGDRDSIRHIFEATKF